jgi:hypothetical protein
MSIGFVDVLFTVCYLLNIGSFLFKSMFWLRLGVLIATIGFVIFSVMVGTNAMIFWNGVFVVVNAYQLVRLILEMRGLEMGPELEAIRDAVFSDMSRRDFLAFWELGNSFETDQGLLTQEYFPQGTMYYLMEGELDVIKEGKVVAKISPNHFVGEMSFMTGDPASAETRPSGKVRVHEWSQEKIRSLKRKEAHLYNALIAVLGRDLSSKLGRADGRSGQKA